MISIFLSHSYDDNIFVEKLNESLLSHGIKTWYSEAEIRPGDSLIEKIELAINECTYLGVVLSPNSVKSEWVKREVNIALTKEIYGKKVKVIPIIHKTCKIPNFLIDKLYVDFTQDYSSALKKLLKRFDDDLKSETYKKKRIRELIILSYQDWISFDKQNLYLLNKESLSESMKIIDIKDYSTELLEYIFCSVSFVSNKDNIKNNIFLKWLTNIDDNKLEEIVIKISEHQNSNIRYVFLLLISSVLEKDLSDILMTIIKHEHDILIQRTILEYISKRKKELPKDISDYIFSNTNDWLLQTRCINKNDKNNVLIISDNSDYANDFAHLVDGFDSNLIKLKSSALWKDKNNVISDVIEIYDIIILIRGENFTTSENSSFYSNINKFVYNGGILLATPWVNWELRHNNEFQKLLPFSYTGHDFFENKQITITQTTYGKNLKLIDENITLRASYEWLTENEKSNTLLRTTDDIPILGFHKYGDGYCFYLNICQHTCQGEMESPLKNPYFRKSVNSILEIIQNIKKAAPNK